MTDENRTVVPPGEEITSPPKTTADLEGVAFWGARRFRTVTPHDPELMRLLEEAKTRDRRE